MWSDLPVITDRGEPYSYSRLSKFRNCPRQFYHSYRQQIQPKGGVMPYLVTGSALHAGADAWLLEQDEDAAIAAALDEWGDYTPPLGTDLGWMTSGHMVNIMRHYCESEHAKGLEGLELQVDDLDWRLLHHISANVDEQNNIYLAESPMTVRWEKPGDDSTPLVTAILDMPAQAKSGGRYIVDRKCKLGWLNQWSIGKTVGVGLQLRMYQAIMEMLTGERFDGAYIEGIYMGKPPKSGWDNVKSVPFSMFGPYSFTEESLDEAREWVLATAADIESCDERQAEYEEAGKAAEYAWPQNDRGGCPSCDYFDLCEANTTTRPAIINMDYEPKERR